MGRSAAEIDAAKAVLATTDLTAVTSEVRQFPPGYVTGGRLKLNTNLQIEVAPIAINIAGKDVRTADTVIIGNEHWIIDGVETPRVPGSWYYLYLSTAAQFAVSPVEPVYNNLYFAYYHPEIQDLRAIGKFYFGNDGTVLYVQTSLETGSSQILIATQEQDRTDANYICIAEGDINIFFNAAQKYLDEVFDGGRINFTDGYFYFKPSIVLVSINTISLQGTGNTIFIADSLAAFALGGNDRTMQGIRFVNVSIGLTGERNKIKNNYWGYNSSMQMDSSYCEIENNYFKSSSSGNALYLTSGKNNRLISNHIEGCLIANAGVFATSGDGALTIAFAATGTILDQNVIINNGNLIDRSICDNSSTSPMIFGEAAPTASNCTWGFTATGPYEGTGQYRFTKTAAAGTIAYLHLVDNVGAADVHGLIPGTQYEWGGWLKVTASASCGFQGFRFYQATTGAGAASAVAWTTATTGWQEVRVTATVYVGATTAYIGLVASASLGAMSFDVDNLRLFPPGTTNVHNQNYYDGGTQTYAGL